MQQRNNHIKPLADPELIRRYLAGELDDKAMHALERQALDDPFLAEALEGFEMHVPDQRMHLADLDKRLAQRVAPAKRKVIPMYVRWAAVAAVCGIVGSGILWLWPSSSGHQDIAKLTIKADTIIPAEVPALVHVPESVTVSQSTPAPTPAKKKSFNNSEADYATTTDQNGAFSLPIQGKSANKQLLTASAAGYQSQSITLKGKSSFVKMQLRKSTDTTLTKGNIASTNKPAPVGGFGQFEKYLATYVQYPAGLTITGKVRVSFLVEEDGTLSDFKVIKKLQPACDEEAIRVIKSGPAWTPATGGKATRVKVDVNFAPTADQ